MMNGQNVLTNREIELIAVGASIAANCGSCLLHHVDAARSAGATDEELLAAVAIGEKIKAEPSQQMRQLAARLIGQGAQRSAGAGGGC